jgi:hypothetical protein
MQNPGVKHLTSTPSLRQSPGNDSITLSNPMTPIKTPVKTTTKQSDESEVKSFLEKDLKLFSVSTVKGGASSPHKAVFEMVNRKKSS